jgi:hypothetical protein
VTRTTVVVVVFGLAELLGVLLALGVVVALAWSLMAVVRRGALGGGPPRLPARDRALVAGAIARARWVPGHDEVDGQTRVLVRRTYTGLDGRPEVLEERVLEAFPAQDPAWEARFTEAMSRARFRCTYLNGEEQAG